MKKIYLILCVFVLVPIGLMAQNDIIYTYDANGNRVTREIDMSKSSVAELDTLNYDEDQLKEQLSFDTELGSANISFFPNPVKQWLNIKASGEKPTTIGEYTVLSNNAKVLKTGTLNSENRIDFKEYPAGLYLLQIEIDHKKQTWKIIKD